MILEKYEIDSRNSLLQMTYTKGCTQVLNSRSDFQRSRAGTSGFTFLIYYCFYFLDVLQLLELSENRTTESTTTNSPNLNDQLSNSSWNNSEETTVFALHRMSPIPLDDYVCDDSNAMGATTIMPKDLKALASNDIPKGLTTPLPYDLRSHRMSPIPIDDIPFR